MSNSKRRERQLIRHYLECFQSLRKLIANDYLRIDVRLPYVWISSELLGLVFFDGTELNKRKALSFLENVRTYINFLRRGREVPLDVVEDDSDVQFVVHRGSDIEYTGSWTRDKLTFHNYVADEKAQS